MHQLEPEVKVTASGVLKETIDKTFDALQLSDEVSTAITNGAKLFNLPGENIASGTLADVDVKEVVPIKFAFIHESETFEIELILNLKEIPSTVPGAPPEGSGS